MRTPGGIIKRATYSDPSETPTQAGIPAKRYQWTFLSLQEPDYRGHKGKSLETRLMSAKEPTVRFCCTILRDVALYIPGGKQP